MSAENYPAEVQHFSTESAPLSGDIRETLPIYKSIELVRAVKIEAIHAAGSMQAVLVPYEGQGVGPFKVSERYVKKHEPQADGYFVLYADGYESYLPALAFEGGYIRMIEQESKPSIPKMAAGAFQSP